uniref:Inositol 1,4,5-trisphosphate receptor-interacting protein n=1 Tax=Sinocyclocheilus rhinocerous TaxID=307959 RepID=A0A673FNI7_9TELE
MEDTLLNVFVVVVSLLLSKDHNVFHNQDDNIMVSMQDHEHFLIEEGAKLEQGEHDVAMELPHSNREDTYSWYFWKTLSLISFYRILKKFLRKGSKSQRKTPRCLNVSKVSDLDSKTLTSFHNQCVLVPPSHSWQTCEFVEGFVNDLLEAVRAKGSDMEIEDFVVVGSLYEQWASRKSVVCDIHVPIVPPKPYSFEFELLKESRGSSTIQYCCRVKITKGNTSLAICPCSNSSLDDDTLCLIHPDKKDNVTESNINDLLCQENSSYLAKTHVVKWFKTAIWKAWDEISHKYEFELIFQNRENPGSLKVRFRSGRVIRFKLTPVVRFKDSEVHLTPYLPSAIFSDTHWPVCFTRYENALLQRITNSLPNNACHIDCLQILSFLHKHQTGLTGPCGLTSFHLKNTLLQLLVNKPSSWDPEQMACRLNDLLTFLQQKVKAKSLNHALVGNSLIPSEIGFPEEFGVGKPVNLFLPLSNEELYFKTNRHLLEMIRNMPVLMYEYGSMRNIL